MKNSCISVVVLSAGFLIGTGMAQADVPPGKPYVEGSLASVEYDYDVLTGSIKDSVGYRILGGYQIALNKKASISPEVFYANFGDADYSRTDVSLEVTGLGFGAKASYSLNPKFDIFGRLAFFSYDLELADIDGDGREILKGFGGEYHIDNRWSLNAAYELVDLEDEDGDEVETSAIRFGLLYKL